jgi:hypothetical protein
MVWKLNARDCSGCKDSTNARKTLQSGCGGDAYAERGTAAKARKAIRPIQGFRSILMYSAMIRASVGR